MAAELAFDPDDWKGIGEWDDMDVPKDYKERSRLRESAKRRDQLAALRAVTPAKRSPHEWPQDEIDLMTRLWKEGLSASQISRQMDGKRSRNAIIGKIDRLGVTRLEAYNSSNRGHGQTKSPRKRLVQRGWSGNDHLFGMTESKLRTKRLWQVNDNEPEAVVATVLMFRTEVVLDEEFDTIETGWGDPWAEFQMAA